MNPSQLRETTMDPNTSRLVKFTLGDQPVAHATIDMLLAKSPRLRPQAVDEEGDKAETLD